MDRESRKQARSIWRPEAQALRDFANYEAAPYAAFYVDPDNPSVTGPSGHTRLTVTFHDLSKDRKDDGTIVAWHWKFWDNTTSNAKDVTKTFPHPGTYHVEETVTDDSGISRTSTDDIEVVDNIPPTATFDIAPIQVNTTYTPYGVQFADTSSDAADGGSIASWSWDFDTDNLGASTSTVQNPTHVYPKSGNYTVRLTVTDSDLPHKQTIGEQVIRVGPKADFTWDPDPPSTADLVTFSDNSSGDDTGSSVTSWSWNFDDSTSNTSTQQNPAHKFSSAGIHHVVLTVTDDHGQQGTTTIDVDVQ
jgi:PKD repeat protein